MTGYDRHLWETDMTWIFATLGLVAFFVIGVMMIRGGEAPSEDAPKG